MKKQIRTSEKSLHFQVCEYLRLQYPNVIFNTDLSGIRLTIGQAVQAKKLRSSNGFPDLVIYQKSRHWSALMIELKKEGTRIMNKSGELADDHIKEQSLMHVNLRNQGYLAQFVIGFDQAKELIDWYLT
jgi:hypothetical protein